MFTRFMTLVTKKKIHGTRFYATAKRFYKNASIIKSEGKFEIILDQMRLKTPKGNVFNINSEPLALAVATEFNSQRDKILQSEMHITTLCNTILDNPNNLTKYDIVTYIVNYLDTDAILFQTNENEELFQLQICQWDPVIEWFNERFGVNLKKSVDMDVCAISDGDKATLTRHLLSHNFGTLHGFMYGIDTLKSGILTLACTEKHISPEQAVLLSRLEEEYQSGRWGRVKWAHDLNQQDMQTRLAAVMLFVHFTSHATKIQQKEV
ncbi:ATP synthase mitochondrial F1 complex assembly factor 2 [Cylas formicarius]|uniref:ATP synthase mitochondrial F1 complex assembly factor 2 n=1 Tax=Cylas formicarius TaxID=197179 RepID=UPI0029589129|nr:ATP synthase mitochondrial F1 complex assembly factor 2 [Cylas formicarius]